VWLRRLGMVVEVGYGCGRLAWSWKFSVVVDVTKVVGIIKDCWCQV
jgi:hypothetical protein